MVEYVNQLTFSNFMKINTKSAIYTPTWLKEHTRNIGKRGEEIASSYLLRSGYDILATNWQIWGGEIDIVARHGVYIVFVEVKFRQKYRWGSALESLSQKKLLHFQKSAELFLMKQNMQSTVYRYDFIAIDQYPQKYRLSHFKNIELKGVPTR
jgi:putative endonuclease